MFAALSTTTTTTSSSSSTPVNTEKDEAEQKILMDQVYESANATELFIKDMVNLYQDNSVVVWNGTELKGREQINNLLAELPVSSHKVECFDCHPISGADKKVANILITVTGKVTYAGTSNHSFHQMIVLSKANPSPTAALYVLQDTMRLTS
eukprot:gene17721-21131_t